MIGPTHIFKIFLYIALPFSSLTWAQTTEQFEWEKTVASEFLNRPIKVHIQVPPNYHNNNEKYRVVYYLDSPGTKAFINTFLAQATRSRRSEKLIAVGIDTSGSRPFYFSPTRRGPHDDFKFPADETGGGPMLFKCIREEIIPMVESTFRADSNGRTLMGHSFAGFFCLFTLVQPDQPFSNIIASSPGPLFWDDNFIFREESSFSQSNKSLPVNLYTTAGSKDKSRLISSFTEFIDQLNSRGYDQLNVKFMINEGDSHVTNMWVTYVRGLSWVLKQKDNNE